MPTITSEALTTAQQSVPSRSPSSSTASTVIDATRRSPLRSSSTLAIASPRVTLVTVAESLLRALSCIDSPFLLKGHCGPSSAPVVGRRPDRERDPRSRRAAGVTAPLSLFVQRGYPLCMEIGGPDVLSPGIVASG